MQSSVVRHLMTGLLSALLLSGCSAPEPWVKPYQRANLADPVMLDSRQGKAGEYIQHVYGARESARGAQGSSGGGCGCN
ncbi:DUF4266 domain-containing protein [Marinobacter sp.]|uniref:DUF4266 domain-containing protein n=1 Tax=Marinobacter sp. TaxID=50741 RepID=UPI00356946B4